VGTWRRWDTRKIPAKGGISLSIKENRWRVDNDLTSSASIADQSTLHARHRPRSATRVSANEYEPFDGECTVSCCEVYCRPTSGGCPRESAAGDPGHWV